jgi:type II secretion system protein J
MKQKKGFTLLEVLIGTAVLSMMVLIIWSITSSTLNSEDRASGRDKLYQMARLALRRVTEDVNMAFLVTSADLLGKTRDGASKETAFIGDDNGDFDKLDFNSLSNWRMFRNVKESDQSEVGYKVEEDPEEPDLYRLMRRQNPYLDDDVTDGGKSYPVAEGVTEFQLSYYDNKTNEWTENWNSKEIDHKNKLPKAVKITIVFADPDDEDESVSFSTITFIGLWQNPIEF